jgi:hypothetical protein
MSVWIALISAGAALLGTLIGSLTPLLTVYQTNKLESKREKEKLFLQQKRDAYEQAISSLSRVIATIQRCTSYINDKDIQHSVFRELTDGVSMSLTSLNLLKAYCSSEQGAEIEEASSSMQKIFQSFNYGRIPEITKQNNELTAVFQKITDCAAKDLRVDWASIEKSVRSKSL